MNKLEALNSPKYSLTPEKMGKLVGGEQVVEKSAGGSVHYTGSSEVVHYSCDTITYANEEDRRHNISIHAQWGGFGDPVKVTPYESPTALQ